MIPIPERSSELRVWSGADTSHFQTCPRVLKSMCCSRVIHWRDWQGCGSHARGLFVVAWEERLSSGSPRADVQGVGTSCGVSDDHAPLGMGTGCGRTWLTA